ncbi:MAG: hypothetical protein O7A09_00920, partial [Proteobacteria bacterium]|nr:hypothetical protein [Pseudomonadota bacterium]
MEGRAISSAEAARTALAIAGTVLLVAGNARASGAGDGDELLAELGCAGCHPGLDVSASRAPDLGSAGLRFESPYVFDYLEHPAPVRRQIGAARMPDFDLGPEQNLSLALFRDGRRRPPPDGPALPPLPGRGARPLPADVSSAAAIDLAEGAGCLQCHSHGERGGRVALDLANAAARLRPAWLQG